MSKRMHSLLAVFLAVAICVGVLQQVNLQASALDSRNMVTLTYKAGAGTGSDVYSDSVEQSSTATSEALTFEEASLVSEMKNGTGWTAPEGKTLLYWIANDANMTHYKPGDAIPLDGSLTVLIAFYGSSPATGTVTLTYRVGAGTGGNISTDPVEQSSTATSMALSFNEASLLSEMKNGTGWTMPAGESFRCWVANDKNLTWYKPGDAVPMDGSVTLLTAIYETPITLTYRVGEGTGDDAVSDPVLKSSTGTSSALTFDEASRWSVMRGGSSWTAPAGRTFLYWVANDAQLTQYKPYDEIPLDGSVTLLTAIYSSAAASTFTLTYKAGEGTGDDAVSDPVTQSSTETTEVLSFEEASAWSQMKGGSLWSVAAGKTFAYWIANDKNSTHYYAGDKVPNDGSVTILTAFYEVPASKGMLQIANKVLSGGTLTNKKFSFTLTPLIPAVSKSNGYYIAGEDVITLTNTADGAISLDQDEVFTQEFCNKYCYDDTNSKNIYNGAYAFLMKEVDKKEKGYTYDPNKYVISIVFSHGKLLDVSAQRFKVDSEEHYRFSSAVDTLFTLSDNTAIFSNSTAKKGYVTFKNTKTTTGGGSSGGTSSGSGGRIVSSAASSGTGSQAASSAASSETVSQTTSSETSSETESQTVSGTTSSKPKDQTGAAGSKADSSARGPVTGDSGSAVIWIVLMGVSAGGFLVVLLTRKKGKQAK